MVSQKERKAAGKRGSEGFLVLAIVGRGLFDGSRSD
jgi:hypothetical protein